MKEMEIMESRYLSAVLRRVACPEPVEGFSRCRHACPELAEGTTLPHLQHDESSCVNF